MLAKLLPTPSDIPPEQIPVLRSNLRMHVLDGSLYVFGMSVVSVQTILPVFMKELGGAPVSIGSVQVFWLIGQNLPSIVIAHHLHRRTEFSSAMLHWGFAHRLMLLVCGIAAALIIGRVESAVAVPLFLLLVFLIPLIGSLAGLPWFQVFTKTVPVKLRGRLMALRQLLGSAAGAVGGSLVSLVLFSIAFPYNFSLLFFVAFGITMASFHFLTRVVEPPSVHDTAAAPVRNIFANAARIIRGDPNFRNYLLADIFLLMSLSSASFYSVFALEKFSLPASTAGTFTAVIMTTNIAANILFGSLADAYGHKLTLQLFALCSMLAGVLAVVSTNILVYGLVFVFLACAVQIQAISRLPFIAELCREQDRMLYVGITNTLTAPTVCIGIVFGWLVPATGYPAIFLVSSLLAVISFLILYRFVNEPRNGRPS